MEESERLAIDLKTYLSGNPEYRAGLVGLKNMGNTCYLNSMIQCLANTEPLVRFFLYELHFRQINEMSTHGTGGRLALAFGELIQDLYIGSQPAIAPSILKRYIERHSPIY